MAAAQQHLYSDNSSRGYSISGFLHAVCASAAQAFSKEIQVRVEAEQGYLVNDTAMPLALIVNELLTNAAKHGINGRGAGQIMVSLTRNDGTAELRVEDDGPGFSDTGSERRSSGLGLVTGLARQLRGTFSIEPGPGARCLIRFPTPREI